MPGVDAALEAMVRDKLADEPVEDLRVDFEDGYGHRDDVDEDAAARAAGTALGRGPRTAFCGSADEVPRGDHAPARACAPSSCCSRHCSGTARCRRGSG